MIAEIISRFEDILKERELDDVSIFLDPDFDDEAPLYARYKQIEFLQEYGDVDLLLMELSLDYLKRATPSIREDFKVFAITVIKDDGPIVPYIFVSKLFNPPLLSSKLNEVGKYIESIVKTIDPESYLILQDDVTVPGSPRIFIMKK